MDHPRTDRSETLAGHGPYSAPLTRRRFLRLALAGSAGLSSLPFLAACSSPPPASKPAGGAAPKVEVTPLPAATAPVAGKPTAAPTAAPAAKTEAKPQGATRPGTSITVVQGSEPTTLDPHYEISGAIGTALNPMFHHLLEYDRKLELAPEAAETYEIMPDGVTYRFKLRRGIKFWNGEPLDANAVKFTYERALNPELRKQGLNDPIAERQGVAEVKVIDDLTVDVVTKQRSAITLILFPLFFILPPGYYGSKSPQEVARAPMGSGPWKFKEWVKDDHLTVVANPDHFRGAPQIESLVFRTAPDRNTRLAMVETGQADLVAGLTPEDFEILDRVQTINKVAVESTYRMHIGIPTNVPRYQDKRVRQALAMAVDFESLNKFVLGGLAKGRMPAPVTGDFWQSPNIKPAAYNPDRAKQLLTEASFPMGEKITIYTFNGQFMKDLDVARAVAADFRKIGLNAEAQPVEGSVLTPKIRGKTIDDLYYNGLAGRSFGPDDLNLINQQSAWDASHWLETSPQAAEFNRLNDQAQVSLDPKEQQQLTWKAMEIFMDESPWIMLHREAFLYGISKRVNWLPSGYSRLHPWLPGEDDVRLTQ